MTRIRYTKGLNGVLTSPLIETVDGVVKVEVNLTTNTFKVVTVKGLLLREGSSTNKHSLLKLVKKTLIDLGASFEDELRTRDIGVTYTTAFTESETISKS